MNPKLMATIAAAIIVIAGAGVALTMMGNDNKARDLDVNLEIYGNADKDWDVDSDDSQLVKSWIAAVESGDEAQKESLSEGINFTFADANKDGIIDSKDVEQIDAIVNGTATHLWFLDGVGNDRDMDIGDIKRIGCEYYATTEAMLILGQADNIVAVDNAPYQYLDFYFTESQKQNVTNMLNVSTPDYGFLNSLDLDVLLVFSPTASYEAKQEKIVDTDVLYLGLYNPDLTNTSKSSFIQGMLKAGYIFGAVDRAEGYTNWIIEYRDKMLNISNSISDEDKPVVAMTNYTNQYFENGTSNTLSTYSISDPLGQAIVLAGGKNILDVLDIEVSGYSFKVGIDALFEGSPVDYFFCHNVKYTYGNLTNTSTPDHGYLVDDYTQIKDATETATEKDLVTDESISLIAGDFRNGCTGGVLLAAYVGNIINPELYKDIDPIAMHNEYVEWLGIEGYDLKEHGVFIYTV